MKGVQHGINDFDVIFGVGVLGTGFVGETDGRLFGFRNILRVVMM